MAHQRTLCVRTLVSLVSLCVLLTPASVSARPPRQAPVPGETKDNVSIQTASITTVGISNAFIAVNASEAGRFVVGTTGGDPGTNNDDNRRLLYGYPSSPGTSFSTVRIVGNGITSDYILGADSSQGNRIAPTTPPAVDGSALSTIWQQDGVRITERLYFSANADTSREDTATIEYALTNLNDSARSIGLRMMLDTMIGGNDGAPFFIQGKGRTTQQFEWSGGSVPQYWLAYESPTFEADSLKGRGVLSGGNLTRPDRFVVADWPQATDTTWDYVVNSADQVTNDSAIVLYYAPMAVASGQTRIVRTQYGIGRSDDDQVIDVTGIEVTQGIQNLRNAVGLIQDRPTVVRVHVKTLGGVIENVAAQLFGTRDGSALPGSPLAPSNARGRISVKAGPVREQIDDGFYFQLPQSWLSGKVELEVKGSGRTFKCFDSASSPSDCRATVSFARAPAIDIAFVGVVWAEEGVDHRPVDSDYRKARDLILATFPVPSVSATWNDSIQPLLWSGQPDDIIEDGVQLVRVATMVAEKRILDGCHWGCKTVYMGVLVDPPQRTYVSGLALADVIFATGGNTAVAYVHGEDLTVAHELGHLAGRSHVNCTGAEAGADEDYPFANGYIGGPGDENEIFYGFSTIGSAEAFGSATGDLMSYCRTTWPSSYTYEKIRENLQSRFDTTLTAQADGVLVNQPSVIVSGQIPLNQWGGEISSVYLLPSPAASSLPPAGEYVLSLRTARGVELAAHSFDPGIPSEGTVGTFTLLLPRPAGTAQVWLMRQGQVLDTRSASPSAPTVTLLSPNGGESLSGASYAATWQGTDADGDLLNYVVQYSADAGTTWQTLVMDFAGTSFSLPVAALAGGSQSLIRVIVSDGFNTGADASNSVFGVAKHAPVAYIDSPQATTSFVGEQSVLLNASGYDLEDGAILTDANFLWSSDRNGNLGAGRSLELNAGALDQGEHLITLTLKDSDGMATSVTTHISVYLSAASLPAGWAVSPDELQYRAIVGEEAPESQLISIRNQGDGTFSWTASAVQPWILLSSLSGGSPSDILVGINAAGLAKGIYTGTVTLSSPDLGSSVQTTVRLEVLDRSPASLELTSSALVLTADGTSTANLIARVADAQGVPTANQVVAFSASGGSIVSQATTDAQGIARTVLRANTTVGPVSVRGSLGTVENSITVLFAPGQAANVSLHLGSSSIPADGMSSTSVTAIVSDRFGHPAPYQVVSFQTTLGTITGQANTDANGSVRAIRNLVRDSRA